MEEEGGYKCVAQSVERLTANPTTPVGQWFNSFAVIVDFFRSHVHLAVMGSWSL